MAVTSTGTSLPPASSAVHLPSATGKALQVKTKSAVTAVPVAGETALLVTRGTLDSPVY